MINDCTNFIKSFKAKPIKGEQELKLSDSTLVTERTRDVPFSHSTSALFWPGVCTKYGETQVTLSAE